MRNAHSGGSVSPQEAEIENRCQVTLHNLPTRTYSPFCSCGLGRIPGYDDMYKIYA
ncbi:unnamed protein product [Nesidiocoris tenuis]|uniref:Uncharacterized protein n=1 Tax=Nesidiocoris tenuis TaxID=355587 RepID=A0A6H5GA86_9HEMI|nr:unnamed protein product [Nesidiocoris tenuis]